VCLCGRVGHGVVHPLIVFPPSLVPCVCTLPELTNISMRYLKTSNSAITLQL
jgi:hypothetical protein